MKELFRNLLVSPNALLLSILVLFLISFQGCGKITSPDNTRIETKGPYSITDTIKVHFERELDTSVFTIQSNNGSFSHHFKDRQNLLIYGDTLALGTPHFRVDKDFSIELNNILDLGKDTVTKPFAVEATFIPWLDGDYNIAKDLQDDYVDTLVHVDQQQWYNKASFQDTLTTEGIIWRNFVNHVDFQDYKALYITPQVSGGKNFSISLKALKGKEFRIFAIGPFKTDHFSLTNVANTLSQEREQPQASWKLLRWADSTSQENPTVSGTLALNLKDYNQVVSSDGLSIEKAFIILRIESKNDNSGVYQLSTHFGK